MSFDLLEQLANEDVPPPPDSLKRDVHDRLNRALLFAHVIELLTQGLIYACGHLLRAGMGLVVYTLSGKFPVDRVDRPDQQDV